MPYFMYTINKVEDYVFKAENEEEAKYVAGLIKAVNDYGLAEEIIKRRQGHGQIDMIEELHEEE